MEEKAIIVEGVTHQLMDPFIVIATQNPVTSFGTQPLPDSQCDRFIIKLSMGYPDVADEVNILKETSIYDITGRVNKVMSRDSLIAIRQYVDTIYASDEILDYICRLCDATRKDQYIEVGVSTRGAIAIKRMACAHALMDNRAYVIPEDVAEVFLPMHDYLLFVIAAALSAGISVLMQLLSGHKWVRIGMVVAVAAGSVVTVLFFSKQWINGATIMLNSVIENWNSKNGMIYYLYVTGDTNVMVSKILFGLTMAAAAALLVNILLVIRWYSAVMMVNFAFFAYCVITSTSSVIWAIVSVCAVTLAYIALIDTDGWLIRERIRICSSFFLMRDIRHRQRLQCSSH